MKTRQELLTEFPNLLPAGINEYPGPVLAAKNIRIELRKQFPQVKFSVTVKQYSMGNNINIRWTGNPEIKNKVEEIAYKYKAGNFDGMTDSYNYEQSDFRNNFGEAKYIFLKCGGINI